MLGFRRLSAFVLLLALAPAGLAAEGESPRQLIDRLGREAAASLGALRNDRAAAEARIRELLSAAFDADAIARRCLEPAVYNSLDAADRAEYHRLFQKWLIETALGLLATSGQETFRTLGVRGQGDNVAVDSEIRSAAGGRRVRVTWFLERRSGGYRIVNLAADGGSLTAARRTEFREWLELGGGDFDYLLEELRIRTSPPPLL
jgi:ABC-type transporter MlaC component